MPYNIPISGLPGSLTLSDPPTSATGGIFNLWKPVKGDWQIVIPLSTDSTCPVTVLVELLQQQKVGEPPVLLAADSFNITSTPTDYPMTVSETINPLEGECNVSGLQVRLTPIERCALGCCPDNPPPMTLNMAMSGDYSGSGTLVYGGSNFWTGNITATPNGDWPGGQFCIKLYCNDFGTAPGTYNWSINMIPCFCGFSSWGTGPGGNPEVSPGSGSCSPFLQTFTGVSSNCTGDPIPPPYHSFTLVVSE